LYPEATTGFVPLFFYESALDILGGFIVLFISRRYLRRLQPGDLAAFWGIWYGLTRSGLELMRTDWDWKLGGLPTAVIVGIAVALIGAIWLLYNHPRGKEPYPYLPPWSPRREGGGGSDCWLAEQTEADRKQRQDQQRKRDVQPIPLAPEPDGRGCHPYDWRRHQNDET